MEDKSYYNKQFKDKVDNRFYVYVHRRLTDNKPFYVGKGSGNRAWVRHRRNPFWTNVAEKHGYKIEIVFDNLNEETSFQCERDTILEFTYFGYTLTNLTNGGEGPSGQIVSEETKSKVSKALKGKKKSKEHAHKVATALRDKSIHTLVNTAGESRTGTREELRVLCGLNTKELSSLLTGSNYRVGNWATSSENFNKSKIPDDNVYTFFHRDGNSFIGTKADFAVKFSIKPERVSMLFLKHDARKIVLDWTLDFANFIRSPRKDSVETKEKKSKAKRGKNYGLVGTNHPSFGKKRTQEVRDKISNALANVDLTRSEEFKDNLKDYWSNQPEIVCPHCGKTSRFKPAMVKHHLDNCKHNLILQN